MKNLFRKKKSQEEQFKKLREHVVSGDVVGIKEIIEEFPLLLDEADHTGMTPLHLAAEKQILSSVACLIDLGANAELKERGGYTATDLAYWHGEYRMGAYTDRCLKIVKRIENTKQRTNQSR